MLKEEFHPVRVPNTTPNGRHPLGIDPDSRAYLGGARRAGCTAGGDGRQRCREGLADGGASVRVAGFEAGDAWRRPARERLCSPQEPRRKGLPKRVIAESADAQTQPSAPVPAPVLDVEPAEPAPKKKRLWSLDERREARVRVAASGDGDSGSAKPQAAVTERRVLIGRGVLVHLTKQGQHDVDQLLGFWVGGAPTAYARRRARSTLRRKCHIWRLPLGCTFGSRPPDVRPSEIFQRSPAQ